MASADLRDELNCSICLSLYTDPVSLRCGHNFCRSCIVSALDAQEAAGVYSCPDCRAEYPQRPALEKNRKLGNIVEHFLSTQPDMEETRIFCTYCIKSPVPAVKSCLQCENSLCDNHLTAHNKTMDHILTEPTGSFGNQICPIHKKVLEYSCSQDVACLCVSCCLIEKHKDHQVELLKEASEKKKKKLRKYLDELNPQKAEIQTRVQNLHDRKRNIQEKASDKKRNVSKIFMDIKEQLEMAEKKALSEISRQEEKIVSQISDLIKKLEIKEDKLSRQMRLVEKIVSQISYLIKKLETEEKRLSGKMCCVEEMCYVTDPVRVLQESDITVCSPGDDEDTGEDGGKINSEDDVDAGLVPEQADVHMSDTKVQDDRTNPESVLQESDQGAACSDKNMEEAEAPVNDLHVMTDNPNKQADYLAKEDDNLGETADDLGETTDDLGETADDLGETTDDLVETTDDLAETADDLAETANDLAETADDRDETADDLAETANDLAETADDRDETTDDRDETSDDLADDLDETTDDLAETTHDLAETTHDLAETTDDLAETTDDLAETADDLDETADDLDETTDDLAETADDLAETTDDLAETADDLTETADDLDETTDDLAETADLGETTDDLAETADDLAETTDDLAEIADLDETTDDLAETADDLAETTDDLDETADKMLDLADMADEDETTDDLAETTDDLDETADEMLDLADMADEDETADDEDETVDDLDEVLISLTLHRSMRDIVTNVTSELGFHVADILLDVDTACIDVEISDDLKTVTRTEEEQYRLETPGRFLSHTQVLSRCCFSSGRHYWEVEWNQIETCYIGMSYPSIEREGDWSVIGNNGKSWCLFLNNSVSKVFHNSVSLILNVMPTCSTFGVFLDYEAGRLSFYELCDPIRHLHTFTASFTEPLHVAFAMGEETSVTIRS